MKRIIVLTFIIISSAIYAQNVSNAAYPLHEGEKLIAMVPIVNNDFKKNDAIANDIFRDTLNFKFVDVSVSRANLNDKATDILRRVAGKDYKRKEIKAFPNLNTVITPEEIKYIKSTFGNADVLLFPIVFNISQSGGMTFGTAKFRVYDLNSGAFIQQFSDSLNMNVSGEMGLEMLTNLLLIGEKGNLLSSPK